MNAALGCQPEPGYQAAMATSKPRRIAPKEKLAAIETAAELLFARAGYVETSMADIAVEAGVAVGTLYRFFPDKPALLAAVHRQVEVRFVAAMERGWRCGGAFAARFAPMVGALFDEAEASREVLAILMMTRELAGTGRDAPGAAFMVTIAAMYREGQAAGAYRDGDAAVAAAIAYGMVEGAMRLMMAADWAPRRAVIETELVYALNAAFLRSAAPLSAARH